MRKVSLALLFCLLCLTGMAQGQKALDLKDITSGRFRPENIQGVIPTPDGEYYTQMNGEGTQIIKYSFKTGEKVEVVFDVNTARECDFKHFDSSHPTVINCLLLRKRLRFTGILIQLYIISTL